LQRERLCRQAAPAAHAFADGVQVSGCIPVERTIDLSSRFADRDVVREQRFLACFGNVRNPFLESTSGRGLAASLPIAKAGKAVCRTTITVLRDCGST
jgi:hypothetical protein